jgi:hypothetical protein
MFYKETIKEKANFSLSASFVTTVLISVNLISIYFLFFYLNMLVEIPNKFYIIIFMVLLWIFNYFFIIKKEKFLNYNFQKDKKGGYVIVIYIILTAVFAIMIANKNRERIFKERELQRNETVK